MTYFGAQTVAPFLLYTVYHILGWKPTGNFRFPGDRSVSLPMGGSTGISDALQIPADAPKNQLSPDTARSSGPNGVVTSAAPKNELVPGTARSSGPNGVVTSAAPKNELVPGTARSSGPNGAVISVAPKNELVPGTARSSGPNGAVTFAAPKNELSAAIRRKRAALRPPSLGLWDINRRADRRRESWRRPSPPDRRHCRGSRWSGWSSRRSSPRGTPGWKTGRRWSERCSS